LLAIFIVYLETLLTATTLTVARTNLQDIVFDQYQRWHPRARVLDQVRVVDIDDESVRRLGQWPWPRQAIARIVQILADAHAAAICIDVLFSEADRDGVSKLTGAPQWTYTSAAAAAEQATGEGDGVLARTLAGRPVVLSEVIANNGVTAGVAAKSSFTYVGDDPTTSLPQLSGILPPLKILAENAAGIGFVNWQPDTDRVVRRVPLVIAVNGHLQPSFAMEALRVAQGASTYIIKSANSSSGEASLASSSGVVAIKVGDLVIPTQPSGDIRAYFAKAEPRLSMPAWKLFDQNIDLADFAEKIVVVGVGASMLSDVVATPLNPTTPGVQAQAQLIEQLLEGTKLLRPDWAFGAELLVATLMSLVLAVAVPMTSAVPSALLGALTVGVIAAVSWVGFTRYGLLLDPVTPSLSSGAVFLAGVLALYGQKRRQLGEIRSLFGRFVSEAVVEQLAGRPDSIELGGQQRRLTLMFCDIRSFTTLAEGFSAVELTAFLNEYLTPMTDVILKRMGTIDKYMGDAIMAFWNAPLDDGSHAANAVHAALEMRQTLAQLNRNWSARDMEAGRTPRILKFGVGLNTGECCVGNLGSTRRFDYSAIGDEVNIASRLEGASKFFEVDIVAGASTRDEAPEFAWLEIDRVVLKNKTRPTAVFALAGDAAYAGSETFSMLARRHENVLAAYRARDFSAAAKEAMIIEDLAPEEIKGLYAVYYKKRFAKLATAETRPDWEAVLALDSK
jgi:adenylate cyclase